ncbi:hypothetical protein FQN55_005421 [Onygenales sp. PD_40]|nr:hypothetical protein FQN55_005421 [Onygenales sp. PD_40]KAK2781180.1 hypothetical protein FQN52_001761 [Onygenales sp. PD_12]
MVTQNGDARYHPPDSGNDVKRPRNNRIVVPHPLANVTPTPPSRNGTPSSPYRAYQPDRSPTSQPTTPDPYSARHIHMPHVPPAYRSPTYPIGSSRGGQPPWTPRSEMGSPRPPLKSSLSTSDMRSRQRSPFRHDQLPSASSPALPRFPQHYHSPELLHDQPRDSLQSALTTSSIEPASGTERSSIATKNSSMTDLSPDASDIDGGMSVDDAISMYLEGFTDDPPPPLPTPPIAEEPKVDIQDSAQHDGEDDTGESIGRNSEKNDRDIQIDDQDDERDSERQQSADLQEAMNSDMPQIVSTPAAEPKHEKPVPKHTPKKLVIPPALPGVVPPPLSAITSSRDQYGFQRTSIHVSSDQYDIWSTAYSSYMDIRKQKWEELLKESGLPHDNPVTFPPKSTKVKRYVRKGIPPEYRGTAWFYYAGGYARFHRHPGHYRKLLEMTMEGPSNDDKEHIERDLHRTFPDNAHFKPEPVPDSGLGSSDSSGSSNPKYRSTAPETEMIQALRRVLYAFSAHNPKIGYTQSLNFIAGMLLLFLPEEKAFWMLDIITSTYLPGTHEISLEGANIDLWILMVALKDSMPGIYTKVASTTPTTPKTKPPAITTKTRLPDITLGLTNWLMSMFIGSLPLETTLRVWDIFFYEGSRTFFRVALAIFKSCEKDILAVSDPMEIFQIVQTAPKKLIDANALADECFNRRFRLTQARVDELRSARKKAIREDKDRLSLLTGRANPGFNNPHATQAASPLPTAWRSLKKHTFK